MIIHALLCSSCDRIIYSRARHDFHWCECKNVAIDGGFDYQKVCFKNTAKISRIDIEVDADKKALYEDWNSQKNKYGFHKATSRSKKFKIIKNTTRLWEDAA